MWQNSITMAEDDSWRFLRHTLSPSFTSGKMRNVRGLISDIESLNSIGVQPSALFYYCFHVSILFPVSDLKSIFIRCAT